MVHYNTMNKLIRYPKNQVLIKPFMITLLNLKNFISWSQPYCKTLGSKTCSQSIGLLNIGISLVLVPSVNPPYPSNT
jgi:hypothetical protein